MLLSAVKYFVGYFVTLFAVVGPLSVLPLFLSMTAKFSKKEKMHTINTGCCVAFGIMLFFALTGMTLFSLFGISIGSFYIAGGTLIFLIGIDMLRSPDTEDAISPGAADLVEDTGKKHPDISIAPFGTPIIAGAGCITNIIILQSQAANSIEYCAGLLAIVVSIAVLYFSLILTMKSSKWLTPSVLRISSRLAGLILASLAIEFIVKGIKNPELGLWPVEDKDVMISKNLTTSPEYYIANERSMSAAVKDLENE